MIPQKHLHPVLTATPETTIREAARRMRDDHIGCLLVVDGDEKPVGLVTDRDLALRALGASKDPEAPVSECMSKNVRTLTATSSIPEATRLMRRHLIRRLPIVDESDKLVGILTADDLTQHLVNDLRWTAETLTTGFDRERQPQTREFSIFGKE
ncbi:MAG: CBS domain-containing protein [bacterium]|nr:CBS domain-containing protein [bacterium]